MDTFSDLSCSDCVYCDYEPRSFMRGYWCLRDFVGDFDDLDFSSDGVLFLGNQIEETSRFVCNSFVDYFDSFLQEGALL